MCPQDSASDAAQSESQSESQSGAQQAIPEDELVPPKQEQLHVRLSRPSPPRMARRPLLSWDYGWPRSRRHSSTSPSASPARATGRSRAGDRATARGDRAVADHRAGRAAAAGDHRPVPAAQRPAPAGRRTAAGPVGRTGRDLLESFAVERRGRRCCAAASRPCQARVGAPSTPRRQQVARVVEVGDPERDGTVAEVVQDGYAEIDGGRVGPAAGSRCTGRRRETGTRRRSTWMPDGRAGVRAGSSASTSAPPTRRSPTSTTPGGRRCVATRPTAPRPRRRSSTSRRPTNVVVGETAKQSASWTPANVVSLIKRQMGTEHRDSNPTARTTRRRRSPR